MSQTQVETFPDNFASSVIAEVEEVQVPVPSDGSVDLPGGWLDQHGQVHKRAEIRELTGADEEAMSRATVKGRLDVLKFLAVVLERGLVSIGGNPANQKMRDSLLIGDRDAILLAIRIATYGEEFETSITCSECGSTRDVAYDLHKDIETRTLADPESWKREVKLRNNRIAELRLVTVLDQAIATSDDARTVAAINTLIMGRVVFSIDGNPAIGEQTMLELGAGDRRLIQNYLVETQPGPQLGEVKGPCPVCNAEVIVALSMPAMFL